MTSAAYDDLIARLKSQGVGEDAAIRYARTQYPDAAAEKAREAEQRANVLEKDEQRHIVRLLREFGFTVYSTSQARASKVSVGIPDLWFAHRELPIAGWFEVKRAIGGRFSEAQKAFAEECRRCHVHYVAGDRAAARSFLIQQGLAQIVGDVLEPIRKTA